MQIEKGQILKIQNPSPNCQQDFAVLRMQANIHRKLHFTAKRRGRDELEILRDSEAIYHNRKEHERARRAIALRLLLMEAIDTSQLTLAEKNTHLHFLKIQRTDWLSLLSTRTRAAMDIKRGKGERIGNIAFGYRLAPDGKHLELEPAEQATLSKIRELYNAGHGIRQIANELNLSGYATRRGSPWRHQYVASAINKIVVTREKDNGELDVI